MRKLTLQNKKDKSNRTKQFLVGGILIGIMFFSVLGYSFSGGDREDEENPNILEYNGLTFVKQDNYWFASRDNLNFIFSYNPDEVSRISSEVSLSNNYYGKPLYVYAETKEAELEIYRNLDPRINQIVQRIQLACLTEENCPDSNSPIKTCENNFIIIREDNITDIIQNESCVFIQGPLENLTRLTDEFLFKAFGIV